VYWTLWVGLRFYGLIALFAAVGITRRRVLWFAAVWPAAAMLARALGWSDAVTWLVAPYAPLFAAGMALYVVHRTGHAVVPWLLVAANTAAATAALVPARMHSLGAHSVVEPSAVLLAVALPACVGLVALVSLTPLARWRWAGLTAAGALTYPLYLTHEYWGLWVVHLLHDRLPVWAVLAAATAFSLLLQPGKQVALIDSGTAVLTASDETGIVDLGRLALGFRAATGPGGITGTPPIKSLDYRPGNAGSTVLLDPDQTPSFFAAIRDGSLEPGVVGGVPGS